MGSKNRISKYILPIMLKYRDNDMVWVEPFVGGANMIDKVKGKRIGSDNNEYLIKALITIRDEPNTIPDLISEDDYQKSKDEMVVNGITGFIGFSMSFGGKWFGGYRRDIAGTKGNIENMKTQTRRSKQSAIKQSEKIKGVDFICTDYRELVIPPKSLIYCDPPYENTTKYKNTFNHDNFWEWCRDKGKEGHIVFISEYNAPKDFICLWKKEVSTTLSKQKGKKDVEKLFIEQHSYLSEKIF
jgi:DNA adenine methylase